MITQAQLNRAIQDWDDMIQNVGTPVRFVLRDGKWFDLVAVRRKRPDENLTDGLQQKGFELQFMHSRWVAAAGANREPEKGDQIEMAGRRHAIERSKLIMAGTVPVGFIIGVLG